MVTPDHSFLRNHQTLSWFHQTHSWFLRQALLVPARWSFSATSRHSRGSARHSLGSCGKHCWHRRIGCSLRSPDTLLVPPGALLVPAANADGIGVLARGPGSPDPGSRGPGTRGLGTWEPGDPGHSLGSCGFVSRITKNVFSLYCVPVSCTIPPITTSTYKFRGAVE